MNQLLAQRPSDRSAIEQPEDPSDTPNHARGTPGALGRLRARRLMDRYALQLAPALAAGLVAAGDLGEPLFAVLLGVVTFAVAARLDRVSLPLHLMPISRVALIMAAPVAGALPVAAIAAYSGRPVPLAMLFTAVIGAWLVAALGGWVAMQLRRSIPIRIAVIGDHATARVLADELGPANPAGYTVVGAIVPAASDVQPDASPPVLGEIPRLADAVEPGSVDILVNAASGSRLQIFEGAAAACLDQGVRMIELDQFYERLLGQVPIAAINGAWFRYLMHPSYSDSGRLAKRAVDLLVGSVVAVLCAPLLAVAAIAILIEGGAPVLYRQRRIGERGRAFSIVKLRTMRVASEEAQERWTCPDDDRVTRVGRWLRSHHIDELPQLWNVLRGEMTLVGPRPEQPGMVRQLEQAIPYYERRHLARPGITGWAQVRCGYAGSEGGTAWKLSHDLYYLKRRSLLTDLLLALETLGAVGYGVQYGQKAPEHQLILGEARAG